MKPAPVLLVLILHAILVLACIALILFRKISLRKEHLIPIIALPLVGPLMALTIEFLYRADKQGKTPLPIDLVTPDHDILWKSLKSYHETGDIVPLEETILIDDVKTRRKFMLQTLYEDPIKYLDVLMLAKNNDDVETSHYATTTISHAQRAFQLDTQELAVAVEQHPDDMVLLDRYIETLDRYIGSGLLEEHLLRDLRIDYMRVLGRKLSRVNDDRETLVRKLRNSIELQDYVSASSISDVLMKLWPEDEQTWIEAVRVCVEGHDHLRLSEIIREIRESTTINWTRQGREQVSAWMEGRMS